MSVALVAVSAQHAAPAKYPAGVNPALCPDFPNCDNARLHNPKGARALPIHEDPLWNAHAVPGVPTSLTPSAHAPVAYAQAPQVIEEGQYDERWNDPNFQGESAPAPQPQWNAAPQPQPQWNAAPQPQWNAAPAAAPQPQWNAPAPVWNYAPSHVQTQFSQWNGPAAAPQPQAYAPQPQAYAPVSESAGGDKYPAGVNPQQCPNYPYCDTNTGVHAGAPAQLKAAPLPGYTERQYPAGVNPNQCPNFPYCN